MPNRFLVVVNAVRCWVVCYVYFVYDIITTRMWANVMAALPNICGALCSMPQSLADVHYRVPCSNAAETRNPLKCAGVPQTGKPISAVSRPTFAIFWGHVEEILLFNSFFSDCQYMPLLQRYGPTKLCDIAQVAIFCVIFASCTFQPAMCSTFQTCILNFY